MVVVIEVTSVNEFVFVWTGTSVTAGVTTSVNDGVIVSV